MFEKMSQKLQPKYSKYILTNTDLLVIIIYVFVANAKVGDIFNLNRTFVLCYQY